MTYIDFACIFLVLVMTEIANMFLSKMGFNHYWAGDIFLQILFWWLVFYIWRLSVKYDMRQKFHR